MPWSVRDYDSIHRLGQGAIEHSLTSWIELKPTKYDIQRKMPP